MTEQELKPIVVQLYTELITRFNARTQDASDEGEIADAAEMLANQIILDMKEADDLDELLSLDFVHFVMPARCAPALQNGQSRRSLKK
jgi:hypothetical protein